MRRALLWLTRAQGPEALPVSGTTSPYSPQHHPPRLLAPDLECQRTPWSSWQGPPATACRPAGRQASRVSEHDRGTRGATHPRGLSRARPRRMGGPHNARIVLGTNAKDHASQEGVSLRSHAAHGYSSMGSPAHLDSEGAGAGTPARRRSAWTGGGEDEVEKAADTEEERRRGKRGRPSAVREAVCLGAPLRAAGQRQRRGP